MTVIRKGAVLLAGLMALSAANAATIYDNTSTDKLTRFSPGTLEVGDEINFGGSSLDRVLTSFSFEYYGLSTVPGDFAGDVTARVKFYYNNGMPASGYLSPGTSFYDSGWFSINPTYNADPALDGRATLVFTAGSDNIPSNGLMLPTKMTFSVQFAGLGLGDDAGLDIYSPPTVGTSQDDYWERDAINGTWTLKNNTAGPINFAANFQAVPEPASALLFAMGLIAFAGFRRK